jgi:SAM-dependent methyltransferase
MRKLIERQAAFALFRPVLAEDHARQMTAEQLAQAALSGLDDEVRVLDLGCGEGDSQDFFRQARGGVLWFGVDIAESAEVQARTRRDGNFATFDGINLPYREDCFDLVFSRQVLEHVRYPDHLLQEVARVLKPGGRFVGSVSYLEPYHSRSIFNFTPYGVLRVFEEAGLELRELRAGIDGPSLILRQMLMAPKVLEGLFRYSPFNLIIGLLGRVLALRPQHINFLKLQFAGHIGFDARKPPAAGTSDR